MIANFALTLQDYSFKFVNKNLNSFKIDDKKDTMRNISHINILVKKVLVSIYFQIKIQTYIKVKFIDNLQFLHIKLYEVQP